MKKCELKYVFSALVYSFLVLQLHSQVLDTTFQAPLPQKQGVATAIGVQPDGKIIVAGNIQYYNEARVFGVLRLNTDGTRDTTFNFSSSANQLLRKIEFLSTGEIIGITLNKLVKINANGALLRTMDVEDNSDFVVDEDQIYLAGQSEFLKVNSDFQKVSQFNQSNNFSGWVSEIEVQNGLVVVAGNFSEVNGEDYQDLAWFDKNGNLDRSFPKGNRTNETIRGMVVMEDGKLILYGEYYTSFDNIPVKGLVRLNTDGTLDTTFKPQGIDAPVSQVVPRDKKMLINTQRLLSGVYAHRVYLMDESGQLNLTFRPVEVDYESTIIASGLEDEVIIGTDLYTQIGARGIYRFDQSGTLDSTFVPRIFTLGAITHAYPFKDKIAVIGDFLSLGGVDTYRVGLINLDGTVDDGFFVKEELTEGGQYNYMPHRVKVNDQGYIFVAMSDRVLKLDSTGELVRDFYTHGIINPGYFAEDIHFLNNGKFITTSPNGMYQLNEDGSNDRAFNENYCCHEARADRVAIQSDQKILYAAQFYPGNEYTVPRLGRINPDGTLDHSFNVQFDFDQNTHDDVDFLHVNADGDIFFMYYKDIDSKHFYKLNSLGEMDSSFMQNLNNSSGEITSNLIPYIDNSFLSVVADNQGIPDLRLINKYGHIVQNFGMPRGVSGFYLWDNPITPVWDGDNSLYLLGKFSVTGETNLQYMIRLIDDPEMRPVGVGSHDLQLSVYPNPASRIVQLSSGDVDLSRATVEVFSLQGKLMKMTQLPANGRASPYDVDVGGLPEGLYVMKIAAQSGQQLVKKLFIH